MGKKKKKVAKSALKHNKKALKKVKKAMNHKKKAIKKSKKVAKMTAKAKLTAACKCSGKKDKHGHGGSCKHWGWRMSWCYVSSKCLDRSAKKSNGMKWIPGCH